MTSLLLVISFILNILLIIRNNKLKKEIKINTISDEEYDDMLNNL